MEEQLIHSSMNFELSNQLNKNPHNVINYRTERKSRIRSKKGQDSLHELSLKEAVDTFQNLQLMSSLPLRMNSNKIKRAPDSEKSEREYSNNSITIEEGIRSSEKSRRGSTATNQAGFAIRLKNKYKEIEKSSHKGKNNFNMKSVEKWLNDLLIEYCSNETFESNIQNPALKRFQIDRNSLISIGINHQDIDRVYRSLFVYSLGFNKLLEQICISSNTISIRRTLWKVYAMLLQYCAKGEFETMIGEIERDKIQKVQSLRDEIIKCHKVIDNVEESVREQKVKLNKEMKLVKDANDTLLSEINILQNDFKKAQIAFNEEVGLRLRFEHKINEIYGVHQELSSKHSNLYKDYHNLLNEYHNQKLNLARQIEKKEEGLVKIIELQGKIDDQKTEMFKKEKQIEKLGNKLKIAELKLDSLQTHRNTGIINARNEIRENKMLHFELSNIKQVLSLKEKSMEEMQRRLEVLVTENEKLFQRVEEQNRRIIDLNKTQHQFEISTLNLKSKIQLINKKLEQTEKDNKSSRSKIEQSENKAMEWEIEVKTSRQKITLLTSNMDTFNKNLQIMKKNKNIIEDELNSIRGKYQQMLDILTGRQTAQAKITQKLNQAQREIIKLKQQLYNIQTSLSVKQEQFKHQKLTNKRIIQKLTSQKQTIRDRKQYFQNKFILLEKETEQKNREFEIIKQQYIDLTFQNANSELRLKQSLMMIEDQSKYTKDLNISISHLVQAREDLNKSLAYTKVELQRKEQEFNKLRIEFQKINKEQLEEINRKIGWIHPMKYSDLEGMWLGQHHIIKQKDNKIQQKKRELNRATELNRQQINKLKANYINQISNLQKQLAQAVEDKNYQTVSGNKKYNKVESELNKKLKEIDQMIVNLTNMSQLNQKQSEKINDLEEQITNLKEQIIRQKKGDAKVGQQQLEQKIIQYELEIRKYEKKIDKLQMELRDAQNKAIQNAETSKVESLIVNKESKQRKQSFQQKRQRRESKSSNKPFEQIVHRISEKSQTQESHSEMNLLPKHFEKEEEKVQLPKIQKEKATHQKQREKEKQKDRERERQRQKQKQKIKVVSMKKQPVTMSRKEVINKMYGAFNYYNSKK